MKMSVIFAGLGILAIVTMCYTAVIKEGNLGPHQHNNQSCAGREFTAVGRDAPANSAQVKRDVSTSQTGPWYESFHCTVKAEPTCSTCGEKGHDDENADVSITASQVRKWFTDSTFNKSADATFAGARVYTTGNATLKFQVYYTGTQPIE